MKCTVFRGRVLLAASTAAVLAACGDDGGSLEGGATGSSSESSGGAASSTDDGDDSGDSTSAGDGSTSDTGASTSDTGASTSDTGASTSDTEGTSTDGTDSDSTGVDTGTDSGSSGDEGSSSTGGEPEESLTPEEVCPFPLASYVAGQVVPYANTTPFAAITMPVTVEASFALFNGTDDADRINLFSVPRNVYPCVVGGDGADLIEIELPAWAWGPYATISGGTGADTFALRLGLPPTAAELPVSTIVDFEAGADRIVFDTSFLPELRSDAPLVFQSLAEGELPAGYNNQPQVVVDAADGEVWFVSGWAGEGATSVQILEIEGAPDLALDDFGLDPTFGPCPFRSTTFADQRNITPSGDLSPETPFTGEASFYTDGGLSQLTAGADSIYVYIQPSTSVCTASTDGDDVLRVYQDSINEVSSNFLIGGDGADVFAMDQRYVQADLTQATDRPVTIADFEPGVDHLTLRAPAYGLESSDALSFGSADDATRTLAREIVVDAADGEIWLADQQAAVLVIGLAGSPDIGADDITLDQTPIVQ